MKTLSLPSIKHWLNNYSDELPSLYLVGGTVRDILIGRPQKDIDLVCKGAKEFSNSLAKRNNAVVVPMEKKPEHPCYRVIAGNDSNNFIDIAEMRGETIYEDIQQRDFTINAIAVEIKRDGSTDKIIDPLNGADDLNNKIIKMAGEGSFASDPLRILRALRFAAALSFEIEPLTLKDIETKVESLAEVSQERILTELFYILSTSQSAFCFRQMDRLGILEVIFPEISAMKGYEQNTFHHKDVWEHSLLVMDNCEHIINNLVLFFEKWGGEIADNINRNNRLPLLKLASILHDIGKPLTGGVHPDKGNITFYNHDIEGAMIADTIAERLRMSNKDRSFLTLIVAEHLHILSLTATGVKSSTKMRWFRKMKDDAIPSIILGMADIKGTQGPASSKEYRNNYFIRSKDIVKNYYEVIKKTLERKVLISGKDLIAIGIAPGPAMGNILRQLREAQDNGIITNHEEAMVMARDLLLENNF
ncbi:MAG: HDIG domain-containing protein [Nitrospirae bacterium]|nr:HDIG domain-containing protein [Nitrospirota bacterium]